MFGGAFLAVVALVFLERRQQRIDAREQDAEKFGQPAQEGESEVKTPTIEDEAAVHQLGEKVHVRG